MTNYIFVLHPALDSIKLHYDVKEIIHMSVLDFKERNFNTDELNLDLKEDVESCYRAWTLGGIGQIDSAKDGTLYIKLTANEIKNMLSNTLSDLQKLVNSWTIADLIQPSAKYKLNNILGEVGGVQIVNCAESRDVLTLQQWLRSEYDRFLNDPSYSEKACDDITIVYQIRQVMLYRV